MKIFILLIILFFITFLLFKRLSNFKVFKSISIHFMSSLLVLLTLTFLIILRVFNDTSSDGAYVPAAYNGKVLIPGKVEFEKE